MSDIQLINRFFFFSFGRLPIHSIIVVLTCIQAFQFCNVMFINCWYQYLRYRGHIQKDFPEFVHILYFLQGQKPYTFIKPSCVHDKRPGGNKNTENTSQHNKAIYRKPTAKIILNGQNSKHFTKCSLDACILACLPLNNQLVCSSWRQATTSALSFPCCLVFLSIRLGAHGLYIVILGIPLVSFMISPHLGSHFSETLYV